MNSRINKALRKPGTSESAKAECNEANKQKRVPGSRLALFIEKRNCTRCSKQIFKSKKSAHINSLL